MKLHVQVGTTPNTSTVTIGFDFPNIAVVQFSLLYIKVHHITILVQNS